jgi:8-oxo-dGTP pyrophosphatase MutT (NUDIX family)
VTCEQGHQHWGLFGAAGVLAYAPDPEDQAGSLVLLQHRARWSHQGGTWALPGGAMDSDETPAEAALREADEECMLDPKLVVPRGMYSEEHGGWAYHTILAQAAAPFRVYSDAYESDEVEWLPAGQVDRRDLHPGFAASWPVLRAALRPLTVVVDGAGIVTARPGPDGTARFTWNEPLVVRAAEVRIVAVADRAQADEALADLAGTIQGRRLVISDRPGVRDRAAAAGAGVAGLNWLLGLLPPAGAAGLDS